MTNSGRREFLKNSMALSLTPAAGDVLLAANPSTESSAAQLPREDFFKGFQTERIKTSGTTIHTMYGGNRNWPPLLLLHGIPETHALWRKVAPALARDYFLVMPDLRGYEDTSVWRRDQSTAPNSTGQNCWFNVMNASPTRISAPLSSW
jgi:pimeloyl-ACP methyl ester carboxylesterase